MFNRPSETIEVKIGLVTCNCPHEQGCSLPPPDLSTRLTLYQVTRMLIGCGPKAGGGGGGAA